MTILPRRLSACSTRTLHPGTLFAVIATALASLLVWALLNRPVAAPD
jgi:hypothetical protein